MRARIVKWSIVAVGIIVGLVTLASLASYILLNRTFAQVYGEQTEVVDISQFQIDAPLQAITNVSVLSPDGGEMLQGKTVLFDGSGIISVGSNDTMPDSALLIDGTGKFLIPGLVDSHVHTQRSPNDLLLYLANGVTQIRSMNGSAADLELKNEIQGGRIGPHFYVSTPSMTSADGFGELEGAMTIPEWIPDFIVLWMVENAFNIAVSDDAAGARSDVTEYIEGGRDGVKLYQFLSQDSFDAIIETADELNVPTVGHLPIWMQLSDLPNTRLREVAHIEELVKALMREYHERGNEHIGDFPSFVASRKSNVASDLAANDIAVQSTLWFSESIRNQVLDLESELRAIRLEYANPGIVEGLSSSADGMLPAGWLPGRNKFEALAGATPEEIAGSKEYWDAYVKAHHILLVEMIAHDVTILAGTDANAWLTVPGFSLHDELLSLNRAGMSPKDVLRSATSAPSEQIGSPAGVIDVGHRADMVLLNFNPLSDIANTQSIHSVIVGGKVLDRDMLDAMLEAVEAANDASRTIDISAYR